MLLVTLALRPKGGVTGGKEIAWPGDWNLDWLRRLRGKATGTPAEAVE